MKEYIERDAFMKEILSMIEFRQKYCMDTGDYDTLALLVAHFTAADVVERKRGEWILGHVEPGYFTPGGNRPWICSECGQVVSWHLDKPKEKFCSECGADMREVDHA